MERRKTEGENCSSLQSSAVSRYSRQLLVPEFGIEAQRALQNSNVLVVGAGGLGCPCIMYLSGAGIGSIDVIDYDKVEFSNLHRQIGHSEAAVGVSKAESVCETARKINSSTACHPLNVQLNGTNATDIVTDRYAVIIDCTDNVPTRYLLNDISSLLRIPLVSGSALKWEGQLTVYNKDDGPCYRCLFPSPPSKETIGRCSENGVIGPVPGVIGTLQAMEVIKLITGVGEPYVSRLLLYDGLAGTFRTVKLRQKRSDCAMCSKTLTSLPIKDYELFCKTTVEDKAPVLDILEKEDRISVEQLRELCQETGDRNWLLLDVRPKNEFAIAALPKAMSAPLKDISGIKSIENFFQSANKCSQDINRVFVLCHNGNDSQEAVLMIRKKLAEEKINGIVVKDIIGGLNEWSVKIDPNFPIY